MHSSCCGGWDRTTDLQVMSLTSYHCSTPRSYTAFSNGSAKLLLFFDIRKYFCKKMQFYCKNMHFLQKGEMENAI